jgi:hypothetical protein
MMEYWNNGILPSSTFAKSKSSFKVFLPLHPFFHHSSIPLFIPNCEAELGSSHTPARQHAVIFPE